MKWLTRAGRVGSIELFGGCQHLREWDGLELRRFRTPREGCFPSLEEDPRLAFSVMKVSAASNLIGPRGRGGH